MLLVSAVSAPNVLRSNTNNGVNIKELYKHRRTLGHIRYAMFQPKYTMFFAFMIMHSLKLISIKKSGK